MNLNAIQSRVEVPITQQYILLSIEKCISRWIFSV